MKSLKPGQLCTINRTVYRAKKRVLDCKGCSLDSPFTCPNMKFQNTSNKHFPCIEQGIILVKV